MNSILILGAGWLGIKAGVYFTNSGFQVTATTRSENKFPELQKSGLNPLVLNIIPGQEVKLPESDVVLISIAPGRGESRKNYPKVIRAIARSLEAFTGIILFCSSTSVYNELKGDIKEGDLQPDIQSDNMITAAEGELMRSCPKANILRLGGLYGTDRHPVFHLAGRKELEGGEAPVNLIHSEDIIRVMEMLIRNREQGRVLNVVTPNHPSRSELYVKLAQVNGLEVPEFKSTGEGSKVVHPSVLLNEMNFKFVHSDHSKWKPV